MPSDNLLRAITAVRTAQDYIKLPGYKGLPSASPTPVVREYSNEKDLWFEVLGYGAGATKPSAGDKIILKGFCLTTWVPRVPGLYWKRESRVLRAAARNEQLPSSAGLGVFNPVGKSLNVLGGVGNVRLLPTSSGRVICASSSGKYWQGVPVLVQGEAFQVYGNVPAGLKAEIHGIWSPMPREHAQGLGGDAGIPRYCLVVTHEGEIYPLGEVRYGLSSAWTLCEHRGPDSRIQYSFIYCTFDTERQSSLLRKTNDDSYSAADATSFIKEYIAEIRGKALTDFDEEIPNFDSQLPVAEMMSRQIDPGRLRTFVERIKKQALSPETVHYEIIPELLMKNFGVEELRTLALDYLALDLDHLVGPSAGQVDHVDRLMEYCEQQDRLEDLAAGIIQERPQLRDELAKVS